MPPEQKRNGCNSKILLQPFFCTPKAAIPHGLAGYGFPSLEQVSWLAHPQCPCGLLRAKAPMTGFRLCRGISTHTVAVPFGIRTRFTILHRPQTAPAALKLLIHSYYKSHAIFCQQNFPLFPVLARAYPPEADKISHFAQRPKFPCASSPGDALASPERGGARAQAMLEGFVMPNSRRSPGGAL